MLNKKYKIKNFLAYFVLLSLFIVLGEGIDDAKSDAVVVSATVASSITCTTVGSPVALGTLTSGAISTAYSTTTFGCSSGLGCTLYVIDVGNGVNGGLATTSPANLIPSPNSAFDATTTLVAGTEGYGIRAATSTAGSGAVLTLATRYKVTGDIVGGLTTTTQAIASSTADTFTGREVVTTHKAAISTVTEAAAYTDTITYSCTSN